MQNQNQPDFIPSDERELNDFVSDILDFLEYRYKVAYRHAPRPQRFDPEVEAIVGAQRLISFSQRSAEQWRMEVRRWKHLA